MQKSSDKIASQEEQANLDRHVNYLAKLAHIERKTKIESSRAYGDEL